MGPAMHRGLLFLGIIAGGNAVRNTPVTEDLKGEFFNGQKFFDAQSEEPTKASKLPFVQGAPTLEDITLQDSEVEVLASTAPGLLELLRQPNRGAAIQAWRNHDDSGRIPRQLFLWWEQGWDMISRDQPLVHICVETMQERIRETNKMLHNKSDGGMVEEWHLIMLDKFNLHEYLPNAEELTVNTNVHANLADRIRVELMYKHGGLYVDASSMLTEDLGWLDDLFEDDKQLKVVVFGTKPPAGWNRRSRRIIETWFLAAVPGSLFMALWRAELTEAWGGNPSDDENRKSRHEAYMGKLAKLKTDHKLDWRHGCFYAMGLEEYFKAYFAATYFSQLGSLAFNSDDIDKFFHLKTMHVEDGPFKMAMRLGGSWVWPGSVQAKTSLYLQNQTSLPMGMRASLALSGVDVWAPLRALTGKTNLTYRYLVKMTNIDRTAIWNSVSNCGSLTRSTICEALTKTIDQPDNLDEAGIFKAIHPKSLFAAILPATVEGVPCHDCNACKAVAESVPVFTYFLQLLLNECQ